MITFLEFYENYLYHNTNLIGLLGINYTKSLRTTFSSIYKDEIDWDTTYADWHKEAPRGYISFTRNKNNRFAPGIWEPIRVTFDRTKLNQKYKIEPYTNPRSSHYGKMTGRHRYESEERIKSPVFLRDGCIKIEIPETEIEQLNKLQHQKLSHNNKVNDFFHSLIRLTIENPLNVIINEEIKDVLPPEPPYSIRRLQLNPKDMPLSVCPICNNENWECTCK